MLRLNIGSGWLSGQDQHARAHHWHRLAYVQAQASLIGLRRAHIPSEHVGKISMLRLNIGSGLLKLRSCMLRPRLASSGSI